MNNPEFQQVIDTINNAVGVYTRSQSGVQKPGGADAFAKDLEKKNQEKLADILPKLDKHLDHNIPTKAHQLELLTSF